jgi:Fe(3+) dicitrate transport protein
MKFFYLVILVTLYSANSFAEYSINGKVTNESGEPLVMANVILQGESSVLTNSQGQFSFDKVGVGKYTLIFFFHGYNKEEQVIIVDSADLFIPVKLKSIQHNLSEVVIKAKKENDFGVDYMSSIEGTAIYASKKNEVILLNNVSGNKSTNNAREIYSKIAGINVWESGGAGLQLGIGARGLNPNRTTNFNTRQNGYDISADALGYPESYYTPPTEALERIEIIRGAASLQYGTQFGGVINFVLKKGTRKKTIETSLRQTIGSFGLLNTFVSTGGTKGTVNYYTFFQRKQGNGWRQNSSFKSNTAYLNINKDFTEKLNIGVEYTYMNYIAQQAGGLTDKEFEQNPQISNRERNWFNVNWNLAALLLDYRISSQTSITNKLFGLYSFRNALGELGRIDRPDPLLNRDLISGYFKNVGNEFRILHRYELIKTLPSAFVIGVRYYRGNTTSKQGEANNNYDASFSFNDKTDLFSDYYFTNNNLSFFVENLFNLTKKLSITPGLRYEYINTQSEGSYSADIVHPNTNEILLEVDSSENKVAIRKILLAGIGTSFKPTKNIEFYANFSQNYRAINFSDIKIVNPNFRIDDNIVDENGWNTDFGIRGKFKNYIIYDITAFYLRYNNRIGSVLKKDTISYQTYRLRTNIGNSKNIGIESFIEIDILKAILNDSIPIGFSLFSNLAILNAKYISSLDKSVQVGNVVEYSPIYNFKTGASFTYKKVKLNYQFTFVSEQFTEATNAEKPLTTATNGLIPSYYVMDMGVAYSYKRYSIETGINNLTNNMYFTRRATAYPGPGIIPSEGRGFYLTIQIKV